MSDRANFSLVDAASLVGKLQEKRIDRALALLAVEIQAVYCDQFLLTTTKGGDGKWLLDCTLVRDGDRVMGFSL